MLEYTRGARMMLQLADADGSTDVADLHAQFDGEAERLAGLFDDRNGNTYISGHLASDDDEMSRSLTASGT